MSYSAVDVDWCLTCSKHLDIPGNGYCSPQCEPSPSSRRWDLNSSDDSDDEEPIYHPVEDTSSAKGIAAWAANVPDGAPPSQLSFSPSRSSSQPKLLHPQSSRPAPPALSMSESTSASIPVATPPSAHRNPSVFSSFASHVKSFVSSPAGFPVGKSKTKPRNDLHKLSITFSSDSSDEDEYDCRPTLSPGDNTFDDVEDLWWVTDSDYSTAPSSPITKKSSAQLIVGSSAARRHDLECELYFQPRVLPPELSSRVSRLGLDDDEEYHIRSTRGRQVR